MQHQALYVAGVWQDAAERSTVSDKWTGAELGTVSVATKQHASAAVDAAEDAMRKGLPPHARARILAGVSRLIEEHAEELAELITAEVGKPISASRTEVARAVVTARLSAQEAGRLPGETVPLDAVEAGQGTFAFTMPCPRGIVAAVTPFNFPLNLVLHKVGPALAAGCAVVLKPSEHAPLTAGMMTRLFERAGLPAGWLNLVTGPPADIVDAWQHDNRVAVVTFTGSSAVGWRLKSQSPRKLHVLELGSNTAMVVAADADLDRAVRDATSAALGGSGQTCVSLQRVYVERPVAEVFLAALVASFAGTACGDPHDERTVVGPLISRDAAQRLQTWMSAAQQAGARVAVGGNVEDRLMAPTVLIDVPRDSPLLCEEAFGPVLSVIVVDSVAEAIDEVNSTDYGLNTAIYTRSLATSLEYAKRAQAGSVLVNMPPSFRADHMPYGGVKGSGQGREGVKYAIADLLQEKLVVLRP